MVQPSSKYKPDDYILNKFGKILIIKSITPSGYYYVNYLDTDYVSLEAAYTIEDKDNIYIGPDLKNLNVARILYASTIRSNDEQES